MFTEPKQIYRWNVEMLQGMTAFTMASWAAMSEFNEKLVENMNGNAWGGNEAAKSFNEKWIESSRKSRQQYRKNLDETFDRLKELFS